PNSSASACPRATARTGSCSPTTSRQSISMRPFRPAHTSMNDPASRCCSITTSAAYRGQETSTDPSPSADMCLLSRQTQEYSLGLTVFHTIDSDPQYGMGGL